MKVHIIIGSHYYELYGTIRTIEGAIVLEMACYDFSVYLEMEFEMDLSTNQH